MPSNATETIDVRILRLIGLEDVFDLDYDTYLTLLKEAMVKGRMPKTTIPPEEVELLTDEWKKLKNKKDKGRFKVKKKKITATALKTGGILTGKKTSIPTSKLLPAAKEGGGGFNIGESFAKIAESVTSIANTLRQKKKLSDKEGSFDRRAEETEKRKLQKQNLKKRFAKMGAVAQKIMQPVQSLLDKMINYFLMIFLGRVVIKLIDWFTDKKNQGKVKTIFRFISDWWPALLGGFLLFGTGLGGLIANLVPMVVGWTFKLAAVIAKHPLLMLALTGGLAAAKLASDSQKASERVIDEEEKKTGKTLTKKEQTDLLTQKQSNPLTGGMLIPSLVEQQVDKPVEDQSDKKIFGLIPYPKPGGLVSGHSNGGWIVPGSGSGDIVPAMLTPGESVLQVGARERLIEDTGVDPLSANIGPNANKPKIMGSTMFGRSGGVIRGYSGGGIAGYGGTWKQSNSENLARSRGWAPDTDPIKTASMRMLKAYEGVGSHGITKPYLDTENIPTIGYGATQMPTWITGENKSRPVRMTDRITAEQADKLKEYDYYRHRKIVENELKLVGISLKHHVPTNVASSLMSLAFNYGSLTGAHAGSSSRHGPNGKMTFPNPLPIMVQIAQQSGDWSEISNLLRYNLSKDNNGDLRQRRLSEANIIDTGSGTGYHDLQNLNASKSINQVGEGKVGNKGIIGSLKDNTGLSAMIPQGIRDMIPKFHRGGEVPIKVGKNKSMIKPLSPPSSNLSMEDDFAAAVAAITGSGDIGLDNGPSLSIPEIPSIGLSGGDPHKTGVLGF